MALARTNLIGSQSTSGIGTAGFTTGAATTTSGEWLVVIGSAVSGTATTATNMTILDSKANTYTSRITLDDGWGVDSGTIRVWTAPVTSAGSTTWTIDQGADSNDQFSISVLSYAGADQTGFGGTSSGNNLATNGAVSTTLSVAPTAADEAVGVWVSDNTGASAPGRTPGATFAEIFDLDSIGHAGMEIEVRTASTSTTVDLVDIDTAGSTFVANAMCVGFVVKAASADDALTTPRPIQYNVHRM